MSNGCTPSSTRSYPPRRGWRQSFSAAVWGSSTGNNASTPTDMHQHDVDMLQSPSGIIPNGVCKKDYLATLTEVVKNIVNARRQYLNNADENWQNFLDNVEASHKFFFCKDPNRMYRETFTIENYRMLFQREASCYRDDVCRGVKRIRDGMWVNGDEVHFPQALQDLGFELAERGEKLMDVVYQLEENRVHHQCKDMNDNKVNAINRFKQAMRSFDSKYTEFEKNYIEALISVEKRSRNLVQTIAEKITRDQETEEYYFPDQELLDNIAELNKKSRDCFNCRYDVKILHQCMQNVHQERVHKKLWYLGKEVVDTFNDICQFLTDLLPKILRVHPKLEHNPGLVARLEKFHDAYNRVSNWLLNFEDEGREVPISSFCDFLDRALGSDSANDLDNDVENILQIPRLFCLFAWEQREKIQNDVNSDIAKFVNELYPDLLLELATVFSQLPEELDNVEESVWQVVDCGINSDKPSELAKSLEVLSMKLQRKNANVWNNFVSVILHEEEEEDERRPRLPSV